MMTQLVLGKTPTLRPYQQQVIRDLYAKIRQGVKRVLIFAPTGSGKTLVGSRIVADATSKNKRSLFLVHRDILVAQTADKLQKMGVNPGFIKAGWKEDRELLVQIASVQTLAQRSWWREYPADVIILDECHILGWATTVREMMDEIYPNSIYIGMTASPWRLSKTQGMADVFDALVAAPMPHELIDQGYLVKPSYYGLKLPLLDKVKTVAFEFDEQQLAIACDRPELIGQIVSEWQRLAWGRRTIAFAVNVQHSQHICEAFLQQGIPAAHVDGTTPIKERNIVYQQLADGEILVLSSCQCLTEGFDVCSVSAIILSRPTQSKALFFQMVGRGLRLSPETEKLDCVVIDQSGNVNRHGFIEDLHTVSLEAGKDSTDDVAPKKVCPEMNGGCGAIIFAFQKKCQCCGYQFVQMEEVVTVQALKQLLSQSDKKRLDFYREKIKQAYRNGYAPGWAAMSFKEKFGHFPPDDWAKNAIFGERPTSKQRQTYQAYLKQLQQQKQKPDSWLHRYLLLEFGRQFAA